MGGLLGLEQCPLAPLVSATFLISLVALLAFADHVGGWYRLASPELVRRRYWVREGISKIVCIPVPYVLVGVGGLPSKSQVSPLILPFMKG